MTTRVPDNVGEYSLIIYYLSLVHGLVKFKAKQKEDHWEVKIKTQWGRIRQIREVQFLGPFLTARGTFILYKDFDGVERTCTPSTFPYPLQ